MANLQSVLSPEEIRNKIFGANQQERPFPKPLGYSLTGGRPKKSKLIGFGKKKKRKQTTVKKRRTKKTTKKRRVTKKSRSKKQNRGQKNKYTLF